MRCVHWVTSVVTVALWGAACVTGTGWSEPAAAAPGPSGGCDFNGDGFEDLAIGVHADNVDGVKKAGSVHVLYGTGDGLARFDDQIWHRGRAFVDGTPRPLDRFGGSVASGDFDGDGFDDLAIGVPKDDVGGFANAGSVQTMLGSADGLSPVGDRVWHAAALGAPEPGRLGASVSAGDFDGNGVADLAAGIPFYPTSGVYQSGAVVVVYGAWDDLDEPESQRWSRSTEGRDGNPQSKSWSGSPVGP